MHSTLRRTLFFFLILIILLNVLSLNYRESNPLQTGGYEDYKKLPERSVDAVYIGNSGVSRYWLCSEAYDKYGMVVFPLATDGIPPWLVQTMLCEAYKYQTPELVIIDVRAFVASVDNCTEAHNHYVLDRLPWFSANRFISIIRTIKAQINNKCENMPLLGLSYFFPILSYHDKWHENNGFNPAEEEEKQMFLGFYCIKNVSLRELSPEAADKMEKSANTVQLEKRVPLEDESEKDLRKLLCYLNNKRINAVFVASPTRIDQEMIGRYNTISDIVSDYGYEFLNENVANINGYGLSYKKDFYEQMHVNYHGAQKYTNYLADYLNTEYDFPNHRNDPVASIFDGVSQQIADFLLDNSESEN